MRRIVDMSTRGLLAGLIVPESLLDGKIPAYEDFLEERRLMAFKIKQWFEVL